MGSRQHLNSCVYSSVAEFLPGMCEVRLWIHSPVLSKKSWGRVAEGQRWKTMAEGQTGKEVHKPIDAVTRTSRYATLHGTLDVLYPSSTAFWDSLQSKRPRVSERVEYNAVCVACKAVGYL